MSTRTKVAVAAGVAACLLIWFLRGTGATSDDASDVQAATIDEELSSRTNATDVEDGEDAEDSELAPALELAEDTASSRESAAAASSLISSPTTRAGPFEYDVEFVPLDALERPLDGATIDAAPWGMPLDRLGASAWNGRLLIQWRGFEPEIELVVQAERDGQGASDLRRVTVHAGASERVTLPLIAGKSAHRGGSASRIRFEEEHATAPGVRAASFERQLENPSAVEHAVAVLVEHRNVERFAFLLDEHGNGVFHDPFMRTNPSSVGGSRSPASPRAFGGPNILELSLEGRGLGRATRSGAKAERIQRRAASISGSLRESDGRPAVHVPVLLATQSPSRRTETTTDENGAFAFEDAPPGRALLYCGGRGRGRLEQELVLERGEKHFAGMLDARSGLRVRLADENGIALPGWRVEAWAGKDESVFAASADTDVHGRATLVHRESGPFRLLARPSQGPLVPPTLLSDHAWMQTGDLEYSIQGASSLAAIALRPLTAGGQALDEAEVRLWNRDCFAGVALERAPAGDREHGRSPWQIAGLVPGTYLLEAGAPGQPWTDLGPLIVRPGAELDLGQRTLAAPAELDISFSAADGEQRAELASGRDLSVRERADVVIEQRRHGAIIRSPVFLLDLPARIPIPVGASALTWTRHAERDRARAGETEGELPPEFEEQGVYACREISGAAGRVETIEIEPLPR